MLKSFVVAVFQSGLIVTAIAVALVMTAVRYAKRFAEKKGYPAVSKVVDRFGYVMCGAMVLTYLFRAASDVGVALGLLR